MARRKKNDFWDDVDALDSDIETSGNKKKNSEPKNEDEEWSAVKSLPLKVFVRFLLMIACLVALTSAYIAYEYATDRYAGGSFSSDFYDSASFTEEYNKSVNQLLQLIQAMEADPTVTQAGNEELLATLVENYMGKDTNFSFIIQDSDKFTITSSGDDAKSRIEASYYYVVVSNVDGETTVQSPISGTLLDKTEWNDVLSETTNTYIIYSAVDNELTQMDGFYTANQSFEKMEDYFNIARFAGIIAAVIFVICLIFCIMSTGMKRGYDGVCLSWFDKIFTEIALVIMIAVAVAIIYAIRSLLTMDGDLYEYGAMALVVVTYGWIIRSYFSIVRRIKAGRLIKSSLIGTVAGAIGRLPSPFNIIVGAVILIAVNGFLVYGVIFLRQYTVRGIPIMFIVAPVVFVIELLVLLTHGGSDEEDGESEESTQEQAKEDEEKSAPKADDKAVPVQDIDGQMDWEALDLGKAIEEAEKNHAQQKQEKEQTKENVIAQETYASKPEVKMVSPGVDGQKTDILSVEDVKKALRASGLTPQIEDADEAGVEEQPVSEAKAPVMEEQSARGNVYKATPMEETFVQTSVNEETFVQNKASVSAAAAMAAGGDGRVNFVQLNKDVRKEFKASLKTRGISVTVRAPEKPVIIDIDRNSLHIIISDIFSQIQRLSAQDARNYVEVYLQGGKVAYIVKIPISAETRKDAESAVGGDGSFEAARKIIEANDGKFVATLDGDTLKVGMLTDAAEA